MKDHKTSMTGIVMSAMSDSSNEVRVTATQCLISFLQLPGLLTSEVTVAELVMDRVFKDEDRNVRLVFVLEKYKHVCELFQY